MLREFGGASTGLQDAAGTTDGHAARAKRIHRVMLAAKAKLAHDFLSSCFGWALAGPEIKIMSDGWTGTLRNRRNVHPR